MKKYNFSFTKTILSLLIAVTALFLAGCVWSVYSVIAYARTNALKTIPYALLLAVCLFLLVVSLSVLFGSKYAFDKDKLIIRIGFMSGKYDYMKIKGLYTVKEQKGTFLTLYAENDKGDIIPVKILVAKKDFSAFEQDLLDRNAFILTGERETDENGKLK